MLDMKTMSEDRFTAMMRDFYATHRGRRASTEDLRRTAEKHVGSDMGWFFDQWVYGTAIPRYRASWRTEPAEGGKHRVRLRVEQHDVPESFTAYVPVTVVLGKDAVARMRVKVQGPVSEIALPLLPAPPAELRFNDLSGVLAEVESVEKE
jgi:aminopeptidase N